MQKKHLMIVGGILLVLGLLGYWSYDHYFRPDQVVREQIADQFGPEFFSSFTVDDLDEEIVPDKRLTNSIRTESAAPGDFEKSNNPPVINNSAASPVQASSPELGPEEAITQKYVPQFHSLEQLSSSRLDILVAAALQEYRQQKATGNVDVSGLARKYIQAGTMLEKGVDGQFYGTLNAMEAELIANNCSTAIIADIEKEYTVAKSRKRAEIFTRARR